MDTSREGLNKKKTIKIGVWGCESAGKTTLMAVMALISWTHFHSIGFLLRALRPLIKFFLKVQPFKGSLKYMNQWQIRPLRSHDKSREFFEIIIKIFKQKRIFLGATPVKFDATDHIAYEFHSLTTDQTFEANFLDLSGEFFKGCNFRNQQKETNIGGDVNGSAVVDGVFDYLNQCNGLLCLVDINSSEMLFSSLFNTLYELVGRSRTRLIEKPIIFCISKADTAKHISEKIYTFDDLVKKQEIRDLFLHPNGPFMDEALGMIETYCNTDLVRFAFISSIGVLKNGNKKVPNIMRDQRGRFRRIDPKSKGVKLLRINVLEVFDTIFRLCKEKDKVDAL